MDMQFVMEGFSQEEAFELNVNSDDYSTFDGERCGICMDLVIDRGVLDCCQHWFCFTCIDNWATVTNLCPLCQNEFQLITCVPVYDTIGSSKTDEDSFSRDDDWCIEGKNNTLSFPSYYIDENAVICLDGDGCKVRSGATTIEEDSNFDTSIACDSCDMWYHALCVGFDTEGTCENSWLCPRCVSNENTEKSDMIPVLRPNNQCDPSGCLIDAAFSGKVSVSVADDGETAVVVSMVEGNQENKGQGQNFLSDMEVRENLKVETLKSSSSSSNSILETSFNEKGGMEFNLEAQELDLSLPQDASSSLLSVSLGLSRRKTDYANKVMNGSSGFDRVGISSRPLFDESNESDVDLNLGLSVGFSMSVDNLNSDVTAEHVAGGVQQKFVSEECSLPVPSAAKISPDTMGEAVGTGCKRKDRDYSDDAQPAVGHAETKAQIEPKTMAKKIKAEENSEIVGVEDQTDEPVSDIPEKCQSIVADSRDEKLRSKSEEENITSIMSIVQGTGRRSSGASDNSSKERENTAGLRVKKIFRRPAADSGSSMLVQTLRKEIREAVRNKSSKEIGENLFDPKLLAAFRAAVAGPATEHNKTSPHLFVKAKKSLLQKGKIRENLTKKIYGISGRRKRAWTRDCEIEFWKHRCLKTTKPEKIETLKSVLNLLRKSPEGTEIKKGIEGEARSSILSRLYLADTSVFPRKDDIKPLSALKATEHPEQNLKHNLMEKIPTPSLGNHATKTSLTNKVSSQSSVVSSANKGNMSANTLSIKHEASSSKAHPNKCPERPSASSLGDSGRNSQKGVINKPDDVKKDKKKWALAVLARKTAATGRNLSQDKEEDSVVLKGNYPLLAQLPIDMRPILAPSRHNKIPISVRQAQLYRLTEHLLRNANLPVICRTAATELAVADAINIEKEIADRSNSKLVYVNLCSQELLHRSDKIKSGIPAESNPSATAAVPVGPSEQAANDLSAGPAVEEALRNAGLLSDTPPNSPHHQAEEINDDDDLSKISEEGPDNVFEMGSHPDLDIYGDFDYDLEDEDLIGASAFKISNLERERESQMQVVFSTFNCDKPNNNIDLQDQEKKMISDVVNGSSCSSECHSDTANGSLALEVRTDGCVPQDALLDEEGEEPSQADCEELYGPDKEPPIKRFPEGAVIKSQDMIANNMLLGKIGDPGADQMIRASGLENENYAQNSIVTTGGLHSSRIENSPGCSQTIENIPIKEKISDTDIKQPGSGISVSKKVETYIKEHIRPLCKSGVITVQQYRWAVGKTTEKVMKYHSKEKNANFLIKEGEKVKKLAQQYIGAAQQMESNQV